MAVATLGEAATVTLLTNVPKTSALVELSTAPAAFTTRRNPFQARLTPHRYW